MIWVYLKEKPNAELIGRMNGNPVTFEHWTFAQKFQKFEFWTKTLIEIFCPFHKSYYACKKLI